MKDIYEATGMSRGGLYSHFGSTREVFEVILKKINLKDEMDENGKLNLMRKIQVQKNCGRK